MVLCSISIRNLNSTCCFSRITYQCIVIIVIPLFHRVTPKSENVKRVDIATPRVPHALDDTPGPMEPLKDPYPSEIDLKRNM